VETTKASKQASKLGTQFSKLVFAPIITKEIFKGKEKGRNAQNPKFLFLKINKIK